MAKNKALAREENETLRSLVKLVLDGPFQGHGAQSRFSKETGISQAHVSGMLNNGAGGGIQSLRALAKYRPVEVVQMLGIKLETIVGLWGELDPRGAEMAALPDNLRRAARAAVELYGCTPDEAHAAAMQALREPTGDVDTRDAELWLMDIRPKLPSRVKSGLRRKV